LAVAAEDALTWVGQCRAGDVLGVTDGEVALIEPGPPNPDALLAGAMRLLDRMLEPGGELITVLLGESAPARIADELEAHVRDEHPEFDLTVYVGGQRDSVLLLGIE
ncbi:MAG: dihydroxyacetone kinase, partial [Sciscionella sp.]|nr:dihydroxyacetone kinase [Sciscionella sp.]